MGRHDDGRRNAANDDRSDAQIAEWVPKLASGEMKVTDQSSAYRFIERPYAPPDAIVTMIPPPPEPPPEKIIIPPKVETPKIQREVAPPTPKAPPTPPQPQPQPQPPAPTPPKPTPTPPQQSAETALAP